MTTPSAHPWRFFRAGGVDQVSLRNGEDLINLQQLDQKLWMALAMPTRGLEFDPKTADILDTDKDGRIRPPEVLAALSWVQGAIKDVGELLRGGDSVALSSIKDPELLAGAKRILASLKKPEAQVVTLSDVSDTAKIFADTTFNGDGVVPADSAGDLETKKAIEDLISVMGSVVDRSGKPGVDKLRLDAFFDQATAFSNWMGKLESTPALAPAGIDATRAAEAATSDVRAKIADYFVRCRLAGFDARAAAAMNRDEKDYVGVGTHELSASSADIAAFPLAQIAPGKPLPLGAGVNPAWESRLEVFSKLAVTPLLGAGLTSLSEENWTALLAKLAPHEVWLAEKPAAEVEKLGLVRIRELLSSDARSKIAALIEQDAALAKEVDQIASVEKLVRFQRDLYALLVNYVSFSEFYGRKGALFQSGTLFLDARSCELCIEVADAGKHAALASLSAAYIAYCEVTRTGEPKKTIAAIFTNGDSDNLMVGRNGVFYDRKGRDWDATITKIVSSPISIREAFWLPYKKLIRAIEDQVSKRAQAAEAESTSRVNDTASAVANADHAKPAEKPPEKKLDLGTIALIGTAIGGVSALVGGFLSAVFALGFWMPLGVGALVLLVSGPSMLLAFLKLRQRNLGPLLDANGWAINTKARMNVPFGAALTRVAQLPAHSVRSLDDPFEEKRRPWKLYITVGLLAVLTYCWFIGRLDPYLPDRIKKSTIFPERLSAPATLLVQPIAPVAK